MTLNLYGLIAVVLLPFCCAFFWWLLDPAEFKNHEERSGCCFGAGLSIAFLWFMIPFLWPWAVMAIHGKFVREKQRAMRMTKETPKETSKEMGIVKVASPEKIETRVISEIPVKGAYR
jgi:hypothetical protein